MKKIIFAALMASTLPAASFAEGFGDDRGIRVGVGESIMGHTIEGSYRMTERLAVRGMYGSGSADYDFDDSGNEYSANLDLGGKGVMIDFYPTNGAFRMSAGALMLDHELTASTTGTTTVNGTTYSSTLTGTGKINKSVSPTVSFGWEKSLFNSPLMLNADLGATYIGGIDTTFTDSSGTIPQADIDAETADLSEKLSDLKVAPFIKVGLSLSF